MTVVPENRETDRLRKSKDANKTKDEDNLKEWERDTDFSLDLKRSPLLFLHVAFQSECEDRARCCGEELTLYVVPAATLIVCSGTHFSFQTAMPDFEANLQLSILFYIPSTDKSKFHYAN